MGSAEHSIGRGAVTLIGVFFTARQRLLPLSRLIRAVFSERGGVIEDARVVVREDDGGAVLLDTRAREEHREFWRALVLGLEGARPPRASWTQDEPAAGGCCDPMGLGLGRGLIKHINGLLQPDGTVVLILARERGLVLIRRVLAEHDDGYVLRSRLPGYVAATIQTARERRCTRWSLGVHGPLAATTTIARAPVVTGPRERGDVCYHPPEHRQECRS
ncbi:MAG: hypothetical protein H6713_10570 [Myxococcales bacterium]|nr:hypothetical protein [Myxococcales bacterium]